MPGGFDIDILVQFGILAVIFSILISFFATLFHRIFDFAVLRSKIIHRKMTIKLDCNGEVLPEGVDFYCLLVRFGIDKFLSSNIPSPQERKHGQFQMKKIKASVIKIKQGYEIVFNLPIHKTLGTQFKCFFESDSEVFEDAVGCLNNCSSVSSVTYASTEHKIAFLGGRKRRAFFLLDYPFISTAETVEGKENNMVYRV